ncbi:hypothetical protein [Mycobacterium deserti]|uniref:3-(3-hydroxyphenyl)propionate hydroxylase n=1 Tax=Mycobacterium deserti TaxID=2978347 RepID=A0ABT2MDK7_9MYCO|nr:hypothetical protein [Mycobacterium deserti]MCT7660343.1 hypothetical protein [Mycobacterium deserti]
MTSIDEALGPGWAILGLDEDPRTAMSAAAMDAWERYGARFFTIRPGTSVVERDELGDPTGQLWDVMCSHGVKFVVVRPDRYVYAATADAHAIGMPLLAAAATRPGGVPRST